MNDFKLYGPCFMCKHKRFFIRKRKLHLKLINKEVTSREMFCKPCFKSVLEAQKAGKLT